MKKARIKLTRKVNKKVTLIVVIIMSFFILINYILLTYNAHNFAELTVREYFNLDVNNINDYTTILKDIAKGLATDEKIINVLKDSQRLQDLTEEDKNVLRNQIYLYKGIIGVVPFIEDIYMFSTEGKYLYTTEEVYDNYNLLDRPWYEERLFNKGSTATFTNIYKNFVTGDSTISMVKAIFHGDKPVGGVVVDISIPQFLKNLNEKFYAGEVKTFVEYNEEFICEHSFSNHCPEESQDKIILSRRIFEEKVNLIYEFEKSSVVYAEKLKNINRIIFSVMILGGIIMAILLIVLTNRTFHPFLHTLENLKVLLKKLQNIDFSDECMDEFEQLEKVSEALSKTIDKKFEDLIFYDELTKLPNRKMLVRYTKKLIKEKKPFGLIFIDLDNFKYVNDMYGHYIGDKLLNEVSRELEKSFKDRGVVTRYSGDEFIIIYYDFTTPSEFVDFYSKSVLGTFSEPLDVLGHSILVEFSAGISVYPKDGETLEELVQKSDFMMYNCKNNSKDISFFNENLYDKVREIENIKLQIKTAIDRNEFLLHYQPIVNNDRELIKVEALIRWNSTELGLVQPNQFIKYAEETGEIINIGYWVIEEVCKAYSALVHLNKSLEIAINVSPIQLNNINFIDNVKKIINEYNIPKEALCFEITESIILDDKSTVSKNIKELNKLGIKLALDDFGTGYSSFSNLSRYELNVLKIDKSFIADLNPRSLNIIKNILEISHVLDMKVVVEGVETEEQFNCLKEAGCDFFQGYFFSKPIPITDDKWQEF